MAGRIEYMKRVGLEGRPNETAIMVRKHEVWKHVIELQRQVSELEKALRLTPGPTSQAERRTLVRLREELQHWQEVYGQLPGAGE